MQITVNIPDELANEAKSRGIAVEKYVEQVLQQRIPSESTAGPARSGTAAGDWIESMARYSDKIPPLPDVISREWLYQDHD